MKISDLFKGSYLIAMLTAVVICGFLKVLGIPMILLVIVAFALGCNNKNVADWVQEHVIDRWNKS